MNGVVLGVKWAEMTESNDPAPLKIDGSTRIANSVRCDVGVGSSISTSTSFWDFRSSHTALFDLSSASYLSTHSKHQAISIFYFYFSTKKNRP